MVTATSLEACGPARLVLLQVTNKRDTDTSGCPLISTCEYSHIIHTDRHTQRETDRERRQKDRDRGERERETEGEREERDVLKASKPQIEPSLA